MRFPMVLALALVTAAALPARAAVVDGTSTTDVFTGVAPGAPDYLLDGAIVSSNGAAADGAFVFDLTCESGAGLVQTIAHFGSSQSSLQVVISTGTVAGAYLAAVSFEQTGGGAPSAYWLAALPSDGALASGAPNLFTFDLSGASAWSLSPQGGFSSGSTYAQISLLFGFDLPGDRLQLDAVGNNAVSVPLPPAAPGVLASLMLFGVAAVVRRRLSRGDGLA